MSLDTVLKIGRALRESQDNLRHFKYVEACPKDKDGNYPFCISIPVREDFFIDWNGIKEVKENERGNLFYLKFKTSDSDGMMKYIFGDVYYLVKSSITKKGEIVKSEAGGYRLENPTHSNAAYRPSSFNRGNADCDEIIKDKEDSNLFKFRSQLNKDLWILESILENISAIEFYLSDANDLELISVLKNCDLLNSFTINRLLEKINKANLKKLKVEPNNIDETAKKKLLEFDYGEIFVHFEFSEGKSWFDFKEDLNSITQKMLSDFTEKSKNGIVLKKTLYKTLCSGDKKNDIQFPDFKLSSKSKSKEFNEDSIQDLFYAIEYSKKGKLMIPNTDIKLIVLPSGDNIKAEDYLQFQKSGNEEEVKQANTQLSDEIEPLFDIFSTENDAITTFDLIFTKKGGTTSPDVDLLEISGIEKSTLRETQQRIAEVNRVIQKEKKQYLHYISKELFPFRISSSIRYILGTPLSDSSGNVIFKANNRYQSHLLKVLPLIYSNNYHSDNSLLSSFINNSEFSIRAGDSKYNFLKFDLKFLLSIQNNQKNKFMDIINSQSYQLGSLLGTLAKNFAGANSPIKSFEKNYVGNLSRRISNLSDFIKLKNDIEQKLIMHEKTNFTYQVSYELAQKVKDFHGSYNKEECAFGFFESYFKPIPKKENQETDTATENN
ncbi:MAG: hypothetical protein GX793_01395 [Bacteroidales bacterium]|jgi:hypothetical protein|nr:hypothetical protein [Bacteroidales bacterium]NLB85693.1 hypothetical protein [Bacteroidales bacterium]